MASFEPPLFEQVMAALFAQLVGAAQLEFTASATDGSVTLTGVSDATGLFPGIPIFGPAISQGALIQAIDTVGGTVTITQPVTADVSAGDFTTGFMTTGRRVRHWDDNVDQPALFLRRLGSEDHYSGEMPITELDCEIWIYSQAGDDPDAIPDAALSNLDWMMRQALAPDAWGDFVRCTLGIPNLVYWARVTGRSDYSPGDQSGQGISRIPVRITLQPQ